MKQGEIWLINLYPTVGAEIKKTRPAINVNDNALGILSLNKNRINKGSFNMERVMPYRVHLRWQKTAVQE